MLHFRTKKPGNKRWLVASGPLSFEFAPGMGWVYSAPFTRNSLGDVAIFHGDDMLRPLITRQGVVAGDAVSFSPDKLTTTFLAA